MEGHNKEKHASTNGQLSIHVYRTTQSGLSGVEEHMNSVLPFDSLGTVIEVDRDETFQTIDGFGFALTGGSALHINQMSLDAKKTLLRELFSKDSDGIHLSFLRISIGASDLDVKPFSYADTMHADPGLKSFSLLPDHENLIPVLKEIKKINPQLKLMATAWSPPVWMKSNNRAIGGSLLPEYYSSYAQYFVKYIQAMSALGLDIDFVSLKTNHYMMETTPVCI